MQIRQMRATFFAAIAVAAAVLSGGPAHAQSASVTTSITVALTSKCQFDSGAALAFTNVAYTAFGPAVNPTKTAAISCTRGATAPQLQWDGGTATATTATGTLVSTAGVVSGLRYLLDASRSAMASGAAPVYSGGSFTNNGSAATATITVQLTLEANQAGTNGDVAQVSRTLTVAY